MKVGLTRIGILENYLPAESVVDVEGPTTLRELLGFLAKNTGPGLIGELLDRGQVKSHLVILLNGQSVRSLPQELGVGLKDGDHVVFSVMIDGG